MDSSLLETKTEETPVDLEKSAAELRKVSEMRHKALSQLIGNYLDFFGNEMIKTNGVSYNQKLQSLNALKEAFLFALDFGLGVTNANIREQGKLSKEVNGLAGVLVQALDNRFILLADNMKKQQDAESATVTNEENKELANG